MTFYSESGNSARFYAVSFVIAAIRFCASISPAFGQPRSTDRDNPTTVTANVITDELDGPVSPRPSPCSCSRRWCCRSSGGGGHGTYSIQLTGPITVIR